jgi:hypothetical protein
VFAMESRLEIEIFKDRQSSRVALNEYNFEGNLGCRSGTEPNFKMPTIKYTYKNRL